MAIMELEDLSLCAHVWKRRTVNLSAYPDLVVIYLGMRVNRVAGIKILRGFTSETEYEQTTSRF